MAISQEAFHMESPFNVPVGYFYCPLRGHKGACGQWGSHVITFYVHEHVKLITEAWPLSVILIVVNVIAEQQINKKLALGAKLWFWNQL